MTVEWPGAVPFTAPLDIVTGPKKVINKSAPDLTAFSLAFASVNLPSIVDTFGESFILGGNLFGARAKMIREWPALRAWLQNSTPHAPVHEKNLLHLVKALLASVTICDLPVAPCTRMTFPDMLDSMLARWTLVDRSNETQ